MRFTYWPAGPWRARDDFILDFRLAIFILMAAYAAIFSLAAASRKISAPLTFDSMAYDNMLFFDDCREDAALLLSLLCSHLKLS